MLVFHNSIRIILLFLILVVPGSVLSQRREPLENRDRSDLILVEKSSSSSPHRLQRELKNRKPSASSQQEEPSRNRRRGGNKERNPGTKKQSNAQQSSNLQGKKGKKSSENQLSDRCNVRIPFLDSTAEDQAYFRDCFGYDTVDEMECDAGESLRQSCKYKFNMEANVYECVCKEKSNLKLFKEIDSNNDGFGTSAEIRTFLDGESCKFPFTYKNFQGVEKTFTSCTTEDDPSGHAWCSIKTDWNGKHISSYYKYCTEEGMVAFGEYILQRFDKNNDGRVSMEEILSEAQNSARKLASNSGDCGNDCDPLPSYCVGLINDLIPECRNRYKTVPLEDDELLRILADAQLQAYEAANPPSDQDYLNEPLRRYNMSNDVPWLSRNNTQAPYTPLGRILPYLPCLIMFEPPVTAVDVLARIAITSILPVWGTVIPLACAAVRLTSQNAIAERTDGWNSVQWSLYEIGKGPHAGETILSYMGTDSGNAEQVIADLWGMPYSKPMMYNMVLEATEIARTYDPTYITGHSLGGFIAQGVCTELGIPGASFGGIGGHDPGSAETSIFQNNNHHGVRFEVVMNSNDVIARTVASNEGSECSFITSSCNVRWLYWSGLNPLFMHSPLQYSLQSLQGHTRGWNDTLLGGNSSLVQLPGVPLNRRCDDCARNLDCESGGECIGGKCMSENSPTYCPADSIAGPETKSPCILQSHCSGYCDVRPNFTFNPFEPDIVIQCEDKKVANENCLWDHECISNECNFRLFGFFQCV